MASESVPMRPSSALDTLTSELEPLPMHVSLSETELGTSATLAAAEHRCSQAQDAAEKLTTGLAELALEQPVEQHSTPQPHKESSPPPPEQLAIDSGITQVASSVLPTTAGYSHLLFFVGHIQEQEAILEPCHYAFSAQHIQNPAAASEAVASAVANCSGSSLSACTVTAVIDGTASTAMLTIAAVRGACTYAFIIVWHPRATEDPLMRQASFEAGANMVSCHVLDVVEALKQISSMSGTGSCVCDWCGQANMTPHDYWVHQPMHHITHSNIGSRGCCICGETCANLAVHIHEQHAPGGPCPERRWPGVPTGSVVVVHRKRDNKFLMMQEYGGKGWWTPGGGTDPGETLRANAARECVEEAGIECEVHALLEVEFGPPHFPYRLITFYGTPKDPDAPLKTLPNFESGGACWVTAEEAALLPLRDPEPPLKWFPVFASGHVPELRMEMPDYAASQMTDVQL